MLGPLKTDYMIVNIDSTAGILWFSPLPLGKGQRGWYHAPLRKCTYFFVSF